MKKINLAGGKGGIQEMAGRAEIITGQSFFCVQEIYEYNQRKKNNKESQI